MIEDGNRTNDMATWLIPDDCYLADELERRADRRSALLHDLALSVAATLFGRHLYASASASFRHDATTEKVGKSGTDGNDSGTKRTR